MNTTLQGNTYHERCIDQLNKWVDGKSIHNNIDAECCPDFSCCGSPLQDKIIWETFRSLYLADDPRVSGMLMGFLSGFIYNEFPDAKVNIVSDNSHKIQFN